MLNRRLTPLIAVFGAMALLGGTPVFAQAPAAAPAADAAAAPAAAPADAAAPAAAPDNSTTAPPTLDKTMGKDKLTPWTMFKDAKPVAKTVMIGLVAASALSWVVLIMKLFEFASLNRTTTNFLEAFRSAKSIQDMGKIAMSEEFEGNPLADMAAAAAQEVALSTSAGLHVYGEHRDSTIERAHLAITAVQASLANRLAGGMQFLASLGSSGPFVGLFGTVYGIMASFIGIATSGTTNLAVVAPGIAEALLATGIGLFAAIPAVIFYNYFQTRIAGFGARTEGFIAELMNALSRQLDKGA
jgi:biopolymer transport protein ExbB